MLDLSAKGAQHALGSTFIERMTGKRHAVLMIGNEAYTRHQLVTQIGTGNFRAARILSDTCKELKVSSVKDLYHISPYQLSSEAGLGVTTMFVLMALFDAKGLDPYRWFFGKGEEKHDVSFDSLKRRALKREAEGQKNEQKAVKVATAAKKAKRTKEFLTMQDVKKAGVHRKVGVATPPRLVGKGKVIDLPEAIREQLSNAG